MTSETLETKTIELAAFDRAVFTGYGELTIAQGDHESLTIETHPDTLPRIKVEVVNGTLRVGQGRTLEDKIGFALETSLTRKRIRYALTVKKLSGVEIGGPFVVSASGIVADRLSVKLSGPADVTIDGLTATELDVSIPGPAALAISGEVEEQWLSLSGPASYRGPRLKSKRASVVVTGPGNATLWAAEALDITIRGIGNIGYYGSPKVHKRVSGIGSVACLGQSPQ